MASLVVYLWIGFLLLFCSTALLFDIIHLLTPLLGLKWPLNHAMLLLYSGLLALAFFGHVLIEASQIKVDEVNITTPKLASGKITIAQISDLHLGAMLGNNFLQRVIEKTAGDAARVTR